MKAYSNEWLAKNQADPMDIALGLREAGLADSQEMADYIREGATEEEQARSIGKMAWLIASLSERMTISDDTGMGLHALKILAEKLERRRGC